MSPLTDFTPHGTFLVIDPDDTPTRASSGILIIGEAGIGKSHTALALIERGHALVADDAPLLTRHPDGTLDGSCPASIENLMEVRGLGLIPVRQLFGERALHTRHRLDMLIELIPPCTAPCSLEQASERRLTGHWQTRNILATPIPMLTLEAQSAPMLALLIETAARHYALRGRAV